MILFTRKMRILFFVAAAVFNVCKVCSGSGDPRCFGDCSISLKKLYQKEGIEGCVLRCPFCDDPRIDMIQACQNGIINSNICRACFEQGRASIPSFYSHNHNKGEYFGGRFVCPGMAEFIDPSVRPLTKVQQTQILIKSWQLLTSPHHKSRH
jgi:hypothetical protein